MTSIYRAGGKLNELPLNEESPPLPLWAVSVILCLRKIPDHGIWYTSFHLQAETACAFLSISVCAFRVQSDLFLSGDGEFVAGDEAANLLQRKAQKLFTLHHLGEMLFWEIQNMHILVRLRLHESANQLRGTNTPNTLQTSTTFKSK